MNDVRRTLHRWRQEYNCECPTARWRIGRQLSLDASWAMQMWKTKNASHMSAAPTTTGEIYSFQQLKLWLWLVEKNGAGQCCTEGKYQDTKRSSGEGRLQ